MPVACLCLRLRYTTLPFVDFAFAFAIHHLRWIATRTLQPFCRLYVYVAFAVTFARTYVAGALRCCTLPVRLPPVTFTLFVTFATTTFTAFTFTLRSLVTHCRCWILRYGYHGFTFTSCVRLVALRLFYPLRLVTLPFARTFVALRLRCPLPHALPVTTLPLHHRLRLRLRWLRTFARLILPPHTLFVADLPRLVVAVALRYRCVTFTLHVATCTFADFAFHVILRYVTFPFYGYTGCVRSFTFLHGCVVYLPPHTLHVTFLRYHVAGSFTLLFTVVRWILLFYLRLVATLPRCRALHFAHVRSAFAARCWILPCVATYHVYRTVTFALRCAVLPFAVTLRFVLDYIFLRCRLLPRYGSGYVLRLQLPFTLHVAFTVYPFYGYPVVGYRVTVLHTRLHRSGLDLPPPHTTRLRSRCHRTLLVTFTLLVYVVAVDFVRCTLRLHVLRYVVRFGCVTFTLYVYVYVGFAVVVVHCPVVGWLRLRLLLFTLRLPVTFTILRCVFTHGCNYRLRCVTTTRYVTTLLRYVTFPLQLS